MNYLQQFKDIILSENDLARKQDEINHLARNSFPTRIRPNSQKTFELLKKKSKGKNKRSRIQTI